MYKCEEAMTYIKQLSHSYQSNSTSPILLHQQQFADTNQIAISSKTGKGAHHPKWKILQELQIKIYTSCKSRLGAQRH